MRKDAYRTVKRLTLPSDRMHTTGLTDAAQVGSVHRHNRGNSLKPCVCH